MIDNLTHFYATFYAMFYMVFFSDCVMGFVLHVYGQLCELCKHCKLHLYCVMYLKISFKSNCLCVRYRVSREVRLLRSMLCVYSISLFLWMNVTIIYIYTFLWIIVLDVLGHLTIFNANNVV